MACTGGPIYSCFERGYTAFPTTKWNTDTTEILLYKNKITEIPAKAFSGLTALEFIRLNENEITAIPDDVFSGLTALEGIYLGFNEIKAIPANVFSGFKALKQISLYNNQITAIPDDVFSGLTALESLGLHLNQITAIPANVFGGLPALQTITLYNNKITEIPANVFIGLTALEKIQLRSNEITAISVNVFNGLTALGYLSLYGSPLTCDYKINPWVDGTAIASVCTSCTVGTPQTITRDVIDFWQCFSSESPTVSPPTTLPTASPTTSPTASPTTSPTASPTTSPTASTTIVPFLGEERENVTVCAIFGQELPENIILDPCWLIYIIIIGAVLSCLGCCCIFFRCFCKKPRDSESKHPTNPMTTFYEKSEE